MSTPALESKNITTTPAADQHILHDGKDYTTIKEGLAYILVPASASKVPQTTPKGENQPQSVFYNPIQQFNRDLSVLAIKAYGEDVLERKRVIVKKREKLLAIKKGKKRKHTVDIGEEEEPGKVARVGIDIARNSEVVDTHVATSVVKSQGNVTSTVAVKADQSHGNGGLGSSADTTGQSDVVPQNAAIEHSGLIKESNGDCDDQNAAEPMAQMNPSFTILDALSATGLRALRYAQEIPFTTSVTANDLLPTATATINLNVEHNKLSKKIKSITGNALIHMYGLVGDDLVMKGRPRASKKYDVIDLDPYGTAAPFLDAAVQAVRDDGGLLCVTCTDAGVWASNGYPEKSYSLYGGIPVKGPHSHEGGLRLILHAIASSAARYGLAMEPLLSLSIDFYARVFVRIHRSPADVKFLAGTTMLVYNCDSGCGAWTTQLLAKNKLANNKKGDGTFYKHGLALAPTGNEHCEHCGTKTHLAGPMYAGPLHSPSFVRRILDGLPDLDKETYKTTDRIEGMLSVALEETLTQLTGSPSIRVDVATSPKNGKNDPAAVDHYPFFFIPSVLSKVIHCVTPHENALRGALRHLGYRVTRSHTKAGSIKTDAPWSVIWEVMREWEKQKAPIREGAVREGTVGYRIMGLDKGREAKTGGMRIGGDGSAGGDKDKPKIVFDEELGKEKDSKKLVRYQLNPRENWGPMNRATGH